MNRPTLDLLQTTWPAGVTARPTGAAPRDAISLPLVLTSWWTGKSQHEATVHPLVTQPRDGIYVF